MGIGAFPTRASANVTRTNDRNFNISRDYENALPIFRLYNFFFVRGFAALFCAFIFLFFLYLFIYLFIFFFFFCLTLSPSDSLLVSLLRCITETCNVLKHISAKRFRSGTPITIWNLPEKKRYVSRITLERRRRRQR